MVTVDHTHTSQLAPTSLLKASPVLDLQTALTPDPAQTSMLEPNSKVQASNVNDNSEATEERSESESEDIELVDSVENQEYLQRITVGKLSRLGLRRPLWNAKFDSFFVILTFLMSYDVLISFTVHFDQYVMFAIAYLVVMLLVGFPLMYMELALGQYSSCTAYSIFDRIAPGFAGIGMATVVFNIYAMMTDQMSVTYFLALFLHSIDLFTNEMPWHNCFTSGDQLGCREQTHNCDSLNAAQSEQFTSKQLREMGKEYRMMGDLCIRGRMTGAVRESTSTLTKTMSEESLGQFLYRGIDLNELENWFYPDYDFFIYMVLAWGAVLFVTGKGHTFIVNQARAAMMLVAAAIASFVVVFVFMVPPKFPHINAIGLEIEPWQGNLWAEAFFLTLRSLKLGQGGLIFLGAQHNFHNNLLADSLIIVIYVVFAPFAYAIVHLLSVDSAALSELEGDMDAFKNKTLERNEEFLYKSGHQITQLGIVAGSFRGYKEYETVILFAYTFMGILLVLANKVVRIDILVQTVMDALILLTGESVRKRVLHLTVAIASIFMFMFCTKFGLDSLIGMENLVFPVIGSVIVIMELFVVCVFYGPRRLFANITFMINKASHAKKGSQLIQQVVHAVVMCLWCIVIPILVAMFIGFKLRHGVDIKYFTVSLMAILLALGPIPFIFVKRADRERAEAVERQIRSLW